MTQQTAYRPEPDTNWSWYVLGMLTFAYALSYIDRQVLNLLVDPIKRALLLSDTQFSLVQGPAFICAYLLASPLFGRLVDITHRRNILLLGVCAWCLFTVLCGTADSYAELFAYRCGVGITEACVFPVGWSLISDFFSSKRMSRALSIFMIGPLIGAGLSLVAGGLVIAFAANLREQIPLFAGLATWQLAFVVVGLPGFLFALSLLTIREPGRSGRGREQFEDREFTLREVLAFLSANRGFYMRILLAIGMIAVVMLGVPAWMPSFLIRFHGVPAASVGFNLGAISVICGATGVLAGPWFARLLERSGYADAPLRIAAVGTTGMIAACAALPLLPGATGVLGLVAVLVFFYSLPVGIIAGAMQLATPRRMRGVVASLNSFFAQLIGFGIGPTAIALVTDKVFGDPRMVGHSLQIVCGIAAALATWLLVAVLPHYRRMLGAGSVQGGVAVSPG